MITRYKNKLFSILGDSISTLEGYSVPSDAAFYDNEMKLRSGVITPADTWWGMLISRLGGEVLINNSFSGSTVCHHPAYEIESYSSSDERTSSLDFDKTPPDVILIYMGTNDWGRGIRVSREEGDVDGGIFFSDCYSLMLEKLKRNYPSAEIWCFTLARSTFPSGGGIFPYEYRGIHMSKYCDEIKRCAQKYGCRVVDLFERCAPYEVVDDFHPNLEGMKRIAEAALSEVERFG